MNLLSGGLFLAVYAYGVIDGFVGHARAGTRERERAVRTALVPLPGGLLIGGAATF